MIRVPLLACPATPAVPGGSRGRLRCCAPSWRGSAAPGPDVLAILGVLAGLDVPGGLGGPAGLDVPGGPAGLDVPGGRARGRRRRCPAGRACPAAAGPPGPRR